MKIPTGFGAGAGEVSVSTLLNQNTKPKHVAMLPSMITYWNQPIECQLPIILWEGDIERWRGIMNG